MSTSRRSKWHKTSNKMPSIGMPVIGWWSGRGWCPVRRILVYSGQEQWIKTTPLDGDVYVGEGELPDYWSVVKPPPNE